MAGAKFFRQQLVARSFDNVAENWTCLICSTMSKGRKIRSTLLPKTIWQCCWCELCLMPLNPALGTFHEMRRAHSTVRGCRGSGTLDALADLHVLRDDSQVLLYGPVILDAARPRTAWPDLSVDWLSVWPCRQREGGVNDLQGDASWCWKDTDMLCRAGRLRYVFLWV